MDTLKKFIKKSQNIIAALLCVAFVSFAAMKVAHDFKTAGNVSALTSQTVKTFTGSINTEATVFTGAASTKLHIFAMDLSSSGAGVVVFKDGTGGTVVLNVYCAANTPRTLSEIFPASGLALTQNILTGTLSGATLTASARTADE